jgi:hypothetical protein
MAEKRDEVVSQGPRLEKKMAYRRDREADYVADHDDSSASRDDTRSEATYFHDIRDRVQRAVDRVLVTAQILLTEGAEGFTHQIDLLSTGQRRYAGFTAVAGAKTEHFGLLATAVEPSCGVHTVADELMLLRLNGSASSFCKSCGPQRIPECGL